MSSIIAVTTDAVTDYLSEQNFGVDVCFTRSYADWTLSLEEAGLRADVVAVSTGIKVALSTPKKIIYQIPIDIAVRRRNSPIELGENGLMSEMGGDLSIDRLVELTEQIHESLTPKRLEGASKIAVWQETKILVCPLLRHLRELKQFTSIVRVTFRAEKRLG